MNDARPSAMPKARKDRLIIKELPDETLIYDLQRDEAHCLNYTASQVWKQCDGQSTVAEVAKSLATETGTALDESIVWLALDQLEEFKLLEELPERPSNMVGLSRRRIIKRIGMAAILLPAIISISAPPASAQISCPTMGGSRPPTCPCSGGGNCLSGVCCPQPAPNIPCSSAGRAPGTCL